MIMFIPIPIEAAVFLIPAWLVIIVICFYLTRWLQK